MATLLPWKEVDPETETARVLQAVRAGERGQQILGMFTTVLISWMRWRVSGRGVSVPPGD